jgi:hypothetical protein
MKTAWDAFVESSKNGTFQHCRDYVEYHGDRFADYSLVVMAEGEILALLPAHRDADEVSSHMGLTFGGLIISRRMSMRLMRDIFDAVIVALRNADVATLIYKTIPYIYHRQPAEEDRDLLYRHGATLIQRNMFTAVDMLDRPPFQQRRLRGIRLAERAGLVAEESERWEEYWEVLTERLATSYDARPVHTIGEITLLRRRFPRHIRLFTAVEGTRIVAGTIVYEADCVARLQYIAASERGRETCALDLLFAHLLDKTYPRKRFVDFGSSNDPSDREINFGLIDFKEGFGGRAVAHDWYRLDLSAGR